MPVIRYVPVDVRDLVIQGEQFRAIAFFSTLGVAPAGLAGGLMDALNRAPGFLLSDDDEEDTGMMADGILPNPNLRSADNGRLVGANALIATPCGALVFTVGASCILNPFTQHSGLWTLSGQTLDLNSAALGNCRVVIFETGRLAVGAAPIVAETTSDGSGNYAATVPGNTLYQAIAYKPGSPDVAGITRNDLTPAAA